MHARPWRFTAPGEPVSYERECAARITSKKPNGPRRQFEFLYESKGALTRNQSTVVFPLMRRAFESVSLCHLFVIKPEFARAWARDKQISNTDARKAMEHHPLTESIEEVKEIHKHFSQGTHPNRTHVPYMFLGEGNQFTLGGIHPIEELTLGTLIRYLMQLCYWYIGIFVWRYQEALPGLIGSDFAREFLSLTPRRKELRRVLDEQLDNLHDDLMKSPRPEGIGPAYSETKEQSGK